MALRLPPLDHLRYFHSAAKHLSFQAAAADLHVTPAAVSQRVRALETLLGVRLFERLTRKVLLTEDGRALAQKVDEALRIIAKGVADLDRTRSGRALTISTTTTFAEQCLLPLLAQFNAEFPQTEVRVLASNHLVDFEVEAVDFAVRQGLGVYEGCHSQLLLDDLYVVVCAPALAATGVFRDDTWRDLPVFDVEWPIEDPNVPSWDNWLRLNGMEAGKRRRRTSVSFEALAIRAAIDGQGLSLVHRAHIGRELATGELCCPFGEERGIRPVFRFYLVSPERERNTKAESFRAWLLKNIAQLP
ncbi:LysR substrate-binding domain-containing protein [Taklimakanibacter lacteus]|uniref:LysR substrate-binding domain-containing protein n=1 Tax=Taklimakanibacter lacteus TaxID=2268456 RepID=UPI000E6660B4